MTETPPERPSDNDCCGSGCTPCVFDAYERMLSQRTHRALASSDERKVRHDLLCPLKYTPFELVSSTPLNRNTAVYSFVPVSDDLDGVLPYNLGQHLIMINVKSHHSAERAFVASQSSISRAYTPISIAEDAHHCSIQFFVKLYDNGCMSSFLKDLHPADVVYLRGAFGDFKHEINSKYLMICAGTGIAPLYPIVKCVLQNERDETYIRFCWACAFLEDVVFRDEISEFCKFWNFKATIYLSKETDTSVKAAVKYGEDIRRRKISLDVVEELVSQNPGYKVLICGSEKFNKDMNDYAERCHCENIFVFQ